MAEATFTNFAAGLVSLKAPNGVQLNMKFDNPENYKYDENPFFGASVGRIANRIFGGKINIQGKEYPLEINEGDGTSLHGGPVGWGKKDWKGPFEEEHNGRKSTVFTITSEHLDQGFPGKVDAKLFYTPYTVTNDEGIDEFFLEIEFECRLADDSPIDETVVHMTNHAYTCVTGNDTVNGTRMKIFSNKWLEKGEDNTITGNVTTSDIVPEDLSFFTLTNEGPQIDHNFVARDLEQFDGLDTRHFKPQPLVHYYYPGNNVNLQIFSTEPSFQVYSGDFVDVPHYQGESRGFGKRCGIAVEPGRPVNAPVEEKWKPWVTLKKGGVYGSKIIYCSWVGETKEY